MTETPRPQLPEASPSPTVFEVAGIQVLIDEDVARIFGVETRRLNEQIKRNPTKFAGGAAYRLSDEEYRDLRSQNATSSGWGGRRHPPTVFTEAGVAMAATVLNTPRAVEAARYIVQVFLHARRQAGTPEPGGAGTLSLGRGLVLSDDSRRTLGEKLSRALGRVLDAIIDPVNDTTVRDEAHAIVLQGLDSLSELLKRPGVQNEHALADAQKLLAEARNLDVEAARKTTENAHRELALLAKQLRLVLLAQDYLETGRMEGFLGVLEDLSKT